MQMANRFFNHEFYSLEKAPVFLFAKATGAGNGTTLTIDATNSKGITSITRTADGDYTFLFNDRYGKLLNVHASVTSIDGSTAPLANAFYVKSFTAAPTGTGSSIALRTYLATIGSLVAPGTNDTWRFTFILSNSSAP
jgi:hypothetical protein